MDNRLFLFGGEKVPYTVYCHTSPSGKKYIGITMQTVEKRWENGYGYKKCPRIYGAIKKYGWENFTHEILMTGLTKEEAEKEEIRLIAELNTADERFGYNIENGGNVTGTHSEETKRKISEGNKGKKVSEKTKEKWRRTVEKNQSIHGEKNPFYGKHHTEETKRAHSEFMKGNTYFKGKHHSEEFKRMKSQQMKEKYKDGNSNDKKLLCLDKEGNIVNQFGSLTKAARAIGVSRSWLCTKIKRNQEFKGFYWRYE